MIKVGITGGIGTGKSTVCRIFSCMGIPIFNSDLEAKKMYDQNPMKAKLISEFGESIYPEGKFNSRALRTLVLNQPERLKILNSIVHPEVTKLSNEWMAKQDTVYVLKESALLIEAGVYNQLDKIILVSSPEKLRIDRLKKRSNLSEEEIRKVIQQQLPDAEKRPFIHFEIVNDEEHALIPQVLKIHEQLISG